MKVNSNTLVVKKGSTEYNEIESIISKIATDNKISDVNKVSVSLGKENGVIKFAITDEQLSSLDESDKSIDLNSKYLPSTPTGKAQYGIGKYQGGIEYDIDQLKNIINILDDSVKNEMLKILIHLEGLVEMAAEQGMAGIDVGRENPDFGQELSKYVK